MPARRRSLAADNTATTARKPAAADLAKIRPTSVLAATPMTVAAATPRCGCARATCRPTASAVPKICRAVNSLSTTTRAAPGPSRSSKPRPRRTSTPACGRAPASRRDCGDHASAGDPSSARLFRRRHERRSALDTPKGNPPARDAVRLTDAPAVRRARGRRAPRARLVPLRRAKDPERPRRSDPYRCRNRGAPPRSSTSRTSSR